MAKKEIKKVEAPVVEKKKKDRTFVVNKFILHNKKLSDWLIYVIKDSGSPAERRTPLSLHSQEARSRNRILKIVIEGEKEVEEQRMELIKTHSKLDKDKNPIYNEAEKRFEIKDIEKFNTDFLTLMKEDYIFDVLPSTVQDFKVVKELFVDKFKSDLSVEDTVAYEELCQAFENI